MTGATPEERATLAGALADGKGTSKDYLLDVAATLRTRAVQQAHVGSSDTDDVELLVEMLEETPVDEQAKLMETVGRNDPGKLERIRAALVTDERFARLGDDLLAAAAMAVPRETLLVFLRAAPEVLVARVLGVLPVAVVGSLREELSLAVPVRAELTADARRTLFRAVRRVGRERGWGTTPTAQPAGPRKVVAL
jgi:flagellar motor switch protein FliG